MNEDETRAKIKELTEQLMARFGRLPTEEEITAFIYGSDYDRTLIWNKEASHG